MKIGDFEAGLFGLLGIVCFFFQSINAISIYWRIVLGCFMMLLAQS